MGNLVNTKRMQFAE